MANPLTRDAAVRGGHGCCAFLPVKLENDRTVLDVTASNVFYTGRIYANKVIQITSGFTVAAEGTVTGNLETTNRGPKTTAFLNKYLSMYTRPGQAAAAAGMETLTDETGWTDDTGTAGGTVPINEQLIAIQFGGEFLNSNDGTSWYIPIDVAMVSLGNETASTTNAANTWGRRNWTLNGHVPENDIEIPLTILQSIFSETANDIGIEIENILDTSDLTGTSTLSALTLRKNVGKEEFIIEVKAS